MESSGRQQQGTNSDHTNWSEENDIHEQEQVNNTNKRWYECIFCKRGFTNAQALGGHMNIHRKDRAKTKQATTTTTSNMSSKHDLHPQPLFDVPSRIISPRPNDYYHPSNYPRANYFENDFFVETRSTSQVIPQTGNNDVLGANLSLRIGSNHEVKRVIVKEDDDVDLELRLGLDHP
ncbi:hypothetical protein ACFE04_012554 [Oxalis oulophora]